MRSILLLFLVTLVPMSAALDPSDRVRAFLKAFERANERFGLRRKQMAGYQGITEQQLSMQPPSYSSRASGNGSPGSPEPAGSSTGWFSQHNSWSIAAATRPISHGGFGTDGAVTYLAEYADDATSCCSLVSSCALAAFSLGYPLG